MITTLGITALKNWFPFFEEGLLCFRRMFGFTIIERNVLFEVVAVTMVKSFDIFVRKNR